MLNNIIWQFWKSHFTRPRFSCFYLFVCWLSLTNSVKEYSIWGWPLKSLLSQPTCLFMIRQSFFESLTFIWWGVLCRYWVMSSMLRQVIYNSALAISSCSHTSSRSVRGSSFRHSRILPENTHSPAHVRGHMYVWIVLELFKAFYGYLILQIFFLWFWPAYVSPNW